MFEMELNQICIIRTLEFIWVSCVGLQKHSESISSLTLPQHALYTASVYNARILWTKLNRDQAELNLKTLSKSTA